MSTVELACLRLGLYGIVAVIAFVDFIFVWIMCSTLSSLAAQQGKSRGSKNTLVRELPAISRSDITRTFERPVPSKPSPGSYSERINLELDKTRRVAMRSRRTARTRHHKQFKLDSIQEHPECDSKGGNTQGIKHLTNIRSRR